MNFIALPRGFSVLLLQHGPSQRFPSPAGRGLKVRDLIQRASSRARLKILSPLRFCPDVCDQKTIFDGTKPPVDGSPSQNHNLWYESTLFALISMTQNCAISPPRRPEPVPICLNANQRSIARTD